MSFYSIGGLLGAFAITFLLSRLVLWLLKSWNGGLPKLISGHVSTLAFCWVMAALGKADGGQMDWASGIVYAGPQIVWLIVDILRKKDAVEANRA